jgi:uncharacterized membrane protein
MSHQKRIENLEWAVRRLAADVASLRASVEALGGRVPGDPSPVELPSARVAASVSAATEAGHAPGPAVRDTTERHAPPVPPPEEWARPSVVPPRVRAPAAAATVDLESMVGRYGAMVLAAITIMLGVGAFIGWAVEHVTLGPEARVALGALGAVAVAVFGEVLRRRGARSYGNSLLALALALVHLVAWGAGPSLGVVPTGAALSVAVAASLALALLAVHEEEQLLFVVGVLGSLVAPFTFAGPEGSLLALLGYGAALRIAGMQVLRGRAWPWAERLLAMGASAYVLATLAVAGAADEDPLRRIAPALFVLVCMASAIVQGGRGGRSVALVDAATLVVAVAVLGQVSEIGVAAAGLGLTGVALGYLALTRSEEPERLHGWAWTLAIPFALLVAGLGALDRVEGRTGATVAALWAAAAAGAAVTDLGRARGGHAFLAGITSALAVFLALHDRQLVMPATLAAHASLAALIAWRARIRELGGAAWITLAVAWLLALGELMQRTPFQYTPFLTRESLVMALVVAAAAVVGRATHRLAPDAGAGPAGQAGAAALAAAPIAAFLWGRTELERAWAPDTATFLLIAYYAVTGTGALLAGRATNRTVLRRTGLAIAIFAALTALVEASGLATAALRIGSYLLVGFFLLAVAYWYRGRGERPSPA